MSDIPYSSINVSGPDSFDFLQAQLTVDMKSLAEKTAVRSAWCNPKGRVICMPYLAENADGYVLTIPTELVDLVTQRMTMFRFRSKVEFAARPGSDEELGIETTVDDWLLENLRAGMPEIWLSQTEKFTPHMLNLDLLDIVSLDKGCYPGQEIIARTHFRGASKRRLLRFESAEPLSPGDKISDGQRDVGEVVNAIGNDLLAVVPIDKKDAPLEVNGVALHYVALPYIG
jgi:folate-binding protein YgfZ